MGKKSLPKFTLIQTSKNQNLPPKKLPQNHPLLQYIRRATKITLDIVKNQPFPFSSHEMLVVLTNDLGFKKVEQRLWGKNEISDVISISYPEPPIAEIIINIDQARRQAPWSLRKETVFLYIHGLIHILGYDDNTVNKKKIMLDYGTKILNKTFEKPS